MGCTIVADADKKSGNNVSNNSQMLNDPKFDINNKGKENSKENIKSDNAHKSLDQKLPIGENNKNELMANKFSESESKNKEINIKNGENDIKQTNLETKETKARLDFEEIKYNSRDSDIEELNDPKIVLKSLGYEIPCDQDDDNDINDQNVGHLIIPYDESTTAKLVKQKTNDPDILGRREIISRYSAS